MKTDTLYISQKISDPNINYLNEIYSGFDSEHVVSNIQDTQFKFDPFFQLDPVFLVIPLALIIALIAFYLLKYRHVHDVDDGSPANMGNDTIYGHNWDTEIAEGMSGGKYGEVIVLCYLRWLEKLNRDSISIFDKSKTPGMFVTEVAEAVDQQRCTTPTLEKTQTLTKHYLRVRYGHKQATRELASQLLSI